MLKIKKFFAILSSLTSLSTIVISSSCNLNNSSKIDNKKEEELLSRMNDEHSKQLESFKFLDINTDFSWTDAKKIYDQFFESESEEFLSFISKILSLINSEVKISTKNLKFSVDKSQAKEDVDNNLFKTPIIEYYYGKRVFSIPSFEIKYKLNDLEIRQRRVSIIFSKYSSSLKTMIDKKIEWINENISSISTLSKEQIDKDLPEIIKFFNEGLLGVHKKIIDSKEIFEALINSDFNKFVDSFLIIFQDIWFAERKYSLSKSVDIMNSELFMALESLWKDASISPDFDTVVYGKDFDRIDNYTIGYNTTNILLGGVMPQNDPLLQTPTQSLFFDLLNLIPEWKLIDMTFDSGLSKTKFSFSYFLRKSASDIWPKIFNDLSQYYSNIFDKLGEIKEFSLTYSEAQEFYNEMSQVMQKDKPYISDVFAIYNKFLGIDSAILLNSPDNPLKNLGNPILSIFATGKNGKIDNSINASLINSGMFILPMIFSLGTILDETGGEIEVPIIYTNYEIGKSIYLKAPVLSVPKIIIKYYSK